MNNKKSRGPSTDPCGTPEITVVTLGRIHGYHNSEVCGLVDCEAPALRCEVISCVVNYLPATPLLTKFL